MWYTIITVKDKRSPKKGIDVMYTLYDIYEGEYEKIGEVSDDNAYNKAYDIFVERLCDTDGECALIYRPNTPNDVNISVEADLRVALDDAIDDFDNEDVYNKYVKIEE